MNKIRAITTFMSFSTEKKKKTTTFKLIYPHCPDPSVVAKEKQIRFE